MDSTAALEVPDVPERLLVVGGGYIGLELGQVYAALGSRVTLVEMTDGAACPASIATSSSRWPAASGSSSSPRSGWARASSALREVGAEVEATLGRAPGAIRPRARRGGPPPA